MASSEQSGSSFTYIIPLPALPRAIEIAFAVFLLCIFLYGPISLGPSRTFESIKADPLIWFVLIGLFAPVIALSLRFAFPPRSWSTRLEFGHDCIRLIPQPINRWIGEPPTEVPVCATAREILICQGSRDTYGGFFVADTREWPYGFRVLVRSADGHTRELKVVTGVRMSARDSEALGYGIKTATGLPVRLIKREPSDEGVMREVSWTPGDRYAQVRGFAQLAFLATPFIGGVSMGIVRPNGLTVLSVGICLWLLQSLAAYLYAPISHRWSRLAALNWLTTAFSFAALYAAMSFVTVNLNHGR